MGAEHVGSFLDLASAVDQHSTAQHSTAQHSTAQHSTAQHSTPPKQQMNDAALSWRGGVVIQHSFTQTSQYAQIVHHQYVSKSIEHEH